MDKDILQDIFNAKKAISSSKPLPGTRITFVVGISGNILEIGFGNDGKPYIISEKPNTTNARQ